MKSRYVALFSIVFLFFPISITAQPACLTGADIDCNNEVNITELLDYIDAWYSCSECVPDMFQAIEAYYGIGPCATPHPADTDADCDIDDSELLAFFEQQLTGTVNEVGAGQYPRYAESNGDWNTIGATHPGNWVVGFFPGSLWYIYHETTDNQWRQWASSWTESLRGLTSSGNHDLGFMIFNSFGHGYLITGDTDYRDAVIEAANTVAATQNPATGTLGIDTSEGYRVIIDGMMAVEMLFWAADNGGPASLNNVAIAHATKTAEDHVRPDGSTYQEVFYNPTTGAINSRDTHQGYNVESTWARGQAWAMYGFTVTYRETGDPYFLGIAERVSDYFINNLPAELYAGDDYVPFWDFEAPDVPNTEKDSSAAAIAASALIQLSRLEAAAGNSAKASEYATAADNILSSLRSPDYLVHPTNDNTNGILLHSISNHGDAQEGAGTAIAVDVPHIYTDYYFIEAVLGVPELGNVQCTPESVAATCGTWVCGSRTNNCGQAVTCPPGCGATEMCTSGVCIPSPVCGNGEIELGENCDDSNTNSGDGCSSACSVETGWICSGEPSTCERMSTDTNIWAEVGGTGTDCSESNPCSLQTAIDNAVPGDIIGLSTGYYGDINFNNRNNANYITIQSLPGHSAGFRSIIVDDSSYWIFRGLEVSPELAETYNPTFLFRSLGSTNNIIVEDCNMYYVQDSSSWSASDWVSRTNQHALQIWTGSDITIRNNTIRNVRFGISTAGSASGTLIEHNLIENIAADGITANSGNLVVQYNVLKNFYHVDANHDDAIQGWAYTENTVIRGNIIIARDVGETSPLIVGPMGINFSPGSVGIRNLTIENNIVLNTGYINGIYLHNAYDARILNNIAFDPYSGSNTVINIAAGCDSHCIVRNNMARSVEQPSASVTSDHNIDLDNYDLNELFVDYQNLDVRHADGSPAIDAGSCDMAPIMDILGVSRPQGFGCDIGAYEQMADIPCTIPASPSAECDDGNACTTDVCGSDLLCDNQPLTGTSCDNGLWCDGADTCQSGICQHAGSPCPADAYSCTTETCTESTQSCDVSYDHSSCDDSDVCTTDTCTATGCGYSFNAEPCDDGDACTTGETCDGSGTCQPAATITQCVDDDGCCPAGCNESNDNNCYDIPPGYVAWWKLDETGGTTANDFGPGGHDGTLVGDAAFVNDPGRGQVLTLDGNGDYVSVPRAAELEPADVSVSLWIRTSNLGSSYPYILSKPRSTGSASYAIQKYTVGTVRYLFYVNEGSEIYSPYVEAAALEDGNWHHLVGTYDRSAVRFYLDGTEVGTGTANTDGIIYNAAYGLEIGAIAGAYAGSGLIDDVMIYGRALTAQEVQQIFDAQS